MKRLAVYTLGFLQVPYVRRMLRHAGWNVVAGPISRSVDAVGVWGRKPRAKRGIDAAKRRSLPLISIEDAFLRSVYPGPKQAPMGLVLDGVGIYFDAASPSRLEQILLASVDDPETNSRARAGIEFLKTNGLSKYNPVARGAGVPLFDGYVLVIDQTRGDASLRCGWADEQTFRDMLESARKDHPKAQIVIRAHPAVSKGGKSGHYSEKDKDDRTTLLHQPVNPWDLLAGASAVYCATSQLGFEAILAGHRPKVFGMPFYAGWGLTDDRQTCARRTRSLTVEQLFAGVMLEYPLWQPQTNGKGSFEQAAQMLLARSQREWNNRVPAVALGISNWKRRRTARFLSSQRDRPVFMSDPLAAAARAKARGGRVVVWASKETAQMQTVCDTAGVPLWRMEDGFLRSTGLGAELVPAASVVMDDLGIYFDATRESRLERLIGASVDLPAQALERAGELAQRIIAARVTKYNLVEAQPDLPARNGRKRILVPGQVEDDASIRLGTDKVNTNLDLLRAVRAANPQALIIYKPHPDVEAGLRPGAVENADELADFVAQNAPVTMLLDQVDEVWTMTSLMGFEALLRGVKTTCLGMPFYAGWGLTDDRGQITERRSARPTLDGLIHASLIDYPLYLDPLSKKPCPPEVLVARLAAGPVGRSVGLTMLAKLQGWFAGYAHLWR